MAFAVASDRSQGTTETVIIVGAGIAGLAAALDLLRLSSSHSSSADQGPKLKVVLLEARDRVGGRIHTQPFCDGSGEGIDVGASFVHGVHDNPLTTLSKTIPFTLYLPPESSASRYLSRSSAGTSLSRSEADRLDYITFSAVFSRLRTLAQTHPHLAFDQSTSMMQALLSEERDVRDALWPSLEDENQVIVGAAKQIMALWAGWTGAPLEQVAVKWWGFEREYEGEDAVVKEGYGRTLIEWHRKEVAARGGEILLDTEVISIKDSEDESSIEVQAKDRVSGADRSFTANRVICTLPLGVLQHRIGNAEGAPALFDPPLPARRIGALHRLGNGLLDKVVLRYSTAWWRDSSLPDDERNPQILLCPPSVHIGKDGSLQKVDGTAAASVKSDIHACSALEELKEGPLLVYDYDIIKFQPTLMAFIAPPLAESLEEESDAEIGRVLHQRLLDFINPATSARPDPPSEVIVTRWRQDPFSHGSYSFLRTADAQKGGQEGSTPLDMDELARPLWEGRLGFAGEHCHADCYASVHGALLAGQREAARVWSEMRRRQQRQSE
ncbi:hypothetical protein OC834_004298 [Tilletia horrida]|uniref:Amine oxidase domain-containing protein n=1 Tax=Tilletia horrida TaxID=155126 RepID=A0AAN6GAN0_9BASI|nr:hypothetical protein OC834_004298 [Tilletia horrida]KAK0530607.1 hypothetical protein OC842_003879 [Tilletia horrida]KAK0531242.1 hypothetical protein OC835_003733 [Tilletia horrida]KAK0560270.1 hypothetical protein OC844_003865 [Tilletia horrida]